MKSCSEIKRDDLTSRCIQQHTQQWGSLSTSVKERKGACRGGVNGRKESGEVRAGTIPLQLVLEGEEEDNFWRGIWKGFEGLRCRHVNIVKQWWKGDNAGRGVLRENVGLDVKETLNAAGNPRISRELSLMFSKSLFPSFLLSQNT